ncbi:MAG: efflux RND transporter periplasmic adaptor subunit [Candidatus Sericytochromatia bacterium]|nr:efflux RND transporter periplasmic adaptor subunit [Candidatus Sericytochromatia bacterium]
MRRRTIVIILVIVLAFGLLVFKRLQERKIENAKLADTKPSPSRVIGTHPKVQPMSDTIRASGSVSSRATVIVSPKVGGRISRLLVEEGAHVQAGQLLAEIDHVEVSAQLAQAEAAVGSAQAAISQGKINAISARTDEKRMKGLIDEKAISQQQYDQSVVKTQLAEQTIIAGQAQLAQAQATVRFNQAQLANYQITAPISGQVTQRNVDGGAMAAAGVALLTLSQTGSLRAEFDLPERQLAKLFRGQTVFVSSSAQPDKPVRATLSEISPVVDIQSRLVRVKVDLANNGVFRPGLSVDGAFVLSEKATALTLPLEAVSVISGSATVMVDDKGFAKSRPVKTGLRTLTQIEILEGLTPADIVVIAGQTFIKVGDPVHVELTGQTAEALAVPSPGPSVGPSSRPSAATKGV